MFIQITKPQLRTLLKSNKMIKLLGALDRKRFEQGHIPGSIFIPEHELENTVSSYISREDLVVVYGQNIASNDGEHASSKLASLGYKHIIYFPGGLDAYMSMHLPLEGKKHEMKQVAYR